MHSRRVTSSLFRKHLINTLSSATVRSRKANRPLFYPPSYRLWRDTFSKEESRFRFIFFNRKVLISILLQRDLLTKASLRKQGIGFLTFSNLALTVKKKGIKKEFHLK